MPLLSQSPTEALSRTGLDPDLLAACQRWVDQRWGLHFPPDKWRDLTRHLDLTARELNCDSTRDLARSLLSGSLSRRQERQLLRELTVGETYFFRDQVCFQTLADAFLAPLIARRRNGSRTLNLWSAGCCTGEEAYSLAMLVDDLLDDGDGWRVNILATDVNRDFLDKARTGVYGAWSFRRVAPGRKAACFEPVPAADGSGRVRDWRIREPWRRRVRFFELNLAEPTYPDPRRGLAELDLILCRNVLMYFSPAQAIAALHRLVRCLSSDGLLLVGAVDGGHCQAAGLVTEPWPAALGIRPDRVVSAPPMQRVAPIATIPTPADPQRVAPSRPMPVQVDTPPIREPPRAPASDPLLEARRAMAAGDYRQALDHVARALGRDTLDLTQEAEAALLNARLLANLNRPEDAEHWARQAIRLDRLQPAHYWVLANILIERGLAEDARDPLAKALYLDPDFALAHYLSGLLCQRRGQRRKARRHLRQCLGLLDDHAPDTPVPEGDGLSTAELRYLATANLTTLDTQGAEP